MTYRCLCVFEVEGDRSVLLPQVATIANYEYGFYWYFYQVLTTCKQACTCRP